MTEYISELDSKRFGFMVAKINDAAKFGEKDFIRLLKERGVQLVISRMAGEKIEVINQLENIGFRIKDMQVTYSFPLHRQPLPSLSFAASLEIREATEKDIQPLATIAADSFNNFGHYFANERLNKERCREIYPDWLRNSILDHTVADKVFVADWDGQVAGSLSFKIQGEGKATCSAGVQGMVDSRFRGNNVFSALSVAGLAWGKQQGHIAQEHNVHTINYPVNRVFSKLGFSITKAFTTLHGWVDELSV